MPGFLIDFNQITTKTRYRDPTSKKNYIFGLMIKANTSKITI